MNTRKSLEVQKQLQQYFALFGKLFKFKWNGGAQFVSREVGTFTDEHYIYHGQSSPYNPQSIGHAKRNVAILKQLIMKTDNDKTPN